jgi:alcohol dehydrogenase (cytochrome c)
MEHRRALTRKYVTANLVFANHNQHFAVAGRNRSRPFKQILVALSFLFLLRGIRVTSKAQTTPDQGKRSFSKHCAVCHGAFGEGGSGPDLSNTAWQEGITDAELSRVVRQGIPGTAMPSFGQKLDEQTRSEIVRYVRALSALARWPTTNSKAPRVAVSGARLLASNRETDNWLMYGHDYANLRFSPLTEINKNNVRNLVPSWSFQTGVPDGLEATPLFVDGVIYLSTSWNHIFAVDAHTGDELWHYKRRLPEKLNFCCGPVNRGVAILDGTLYMATLDAHLVALDAQTGRARWDVEMGKIEDNLSATSPPLIIGNRVLVGIAGGDYQSRGFIDAYDAKTGQRAWRFYTIPENEKESATHRHDPADHDSTKLGGGGAWMTGSYDPELNLVYWGTGNPYPDYDGDAREGNNLYTDCVVALKPESGELVWHYQFTPHDVWDYDGVNEMVLVNLQYHGHKTKSLIHADRNGYFYAIERSTGRFLYAKPFVRATWTKGFDPAGRPAVDPKAIPTAQGVPVCPGAAGGKEWNGMAFSPLTRMAYVPAIENCAVFLNNGVKARRLNLPPGESGFKYIPNQAYGKFMAINADTGDVAWEFRTRSPLAGGVLATAGGLVFTGDPEGHFTVYDADNGQALWSYQTGSGMRGGPISYQLDGEQYIAVLSGMGGAVGGFTGAGAPWMRDYRSGDTMYVFRLFNAAGLSKPK